MNHQPPRTLAVWLTMLLAAGCAAVASVPPVLDPGPAQKAVATVAAAGVQVYECKGSAWAFVAPEARLFDTEGRDIGSHGAGPFWQALDGSRVEGSVKARADAPQAGAIPWLLLATHSTGTAGRFAAVTHIQRIHTDGGQAPGFGCDAQHQGKQLRVPYRAKYRLFVPA